MRGGRADVIVIGAGLAGLHAALELEARGLDVLVLEAHARIGGRVHSMRQLGSNAEAGGTYIGAGYERVIATAERFGIRLIDVTPMLEYFREQELVLGGEIIRQRDWPDHSANPFTGDYREIMPWNFHRVLTMRENPLAAPADWIHPEHAHLDVSMHDWMRGLGWSSDAVRIGYGINTSFGDDATDVSALLLLARAAFSRAQRELAPKGVVGFTVENGVQRIPEAMAAALGHDVALEHAVESVTQTQSAVRVRCADGAVYGADRVICSVPFGALRSIEMDPPLEGLHARAVHEIDSQAITQVYIDAKEPFWEGDGYAASMFTDSLAGMVAGVRDGTNPSRITHLSAWVLGPNARRLDRLGTAEAGRQVIAAIERIRPAAKGKLALIGLKSWGGDPFAHGAWATFKPGQVSRFAQALGAAHGRMHFCGEHLARSCRGMEAALETAERAVAEALRTD